MTLQTRVSFDAKGMIDLIDREKGYFRKGLQSQLRAAHFKMTAKLQQAAVDKLEAAQESHAPDRPQRPGERLRKTILDDRNREVGFTAFAVGVEKWLDQDSPAKMYWRSIEEGLGSYTTRALFTNAWPGGQLFRPGQGGPHMRMPQFTQPFVGANGSRFLAKEIHVKAFPGYHYLSGMTPAFGRMDVAAFYRAEGVPIAAFKGVGKK